MKNGIAVADQNRAPGKPLRQEQPQEQEPEKESSPQIPMSKLPRWVVYDRQVFLKKKNDGAFPPNI